MTNSHDFSDTPAAPAPSERSLRYWLKAVDALISQEQAQRFEAEGATRRDLRILTAIAEPDSVPAELRARLDRGGKRVFALAERGWIIRSGGGWQLTAEGEAARVRFTTAAQETRDRVTGAASPEDLATTRSTLEAIARELGWTEDTRLPRRGHRHPHGFRGRGERGRFGGEHHHNGHAPRPGHCSHSERAGGWASDRRECGTPADHRTGRGRGHGHGHGHGHDQGFGPDTGWGRDADWGRGPRDGHGADRGFSGRGHGRGAGRAAFERGYSAGFVAGHGVSDAR